MYLCKTSLVLMAALLRNVHSTESGPTLLVLCTKEFIRIKVLLNYHNFFGVVYTRPNRNTCSVLGVGEREMTLYVPLAEPGRSDCGVALQDDYYSVVIDIRKHHILEMTSDTSFLVQCSASEIGKLKSSPKQEMTLDILENDERVRETVVGRSYTVQLHVPNTYFYQVTSCVAFSGQDTIKFVPLMDSSGCPIENMITPFFPVYGTGKIRAELTMFRFNDSNEFYIQCTVSKCKDRCITPTCRNDKDAKLFGPRILTQNAEEAFAAFRVAVLDQSQTSTMIRYTGCNYADQPSLYGLIVMLLLLVFLTFVLCALAIHNRPFQCHIQERDTISVNEELIQIVEEPQDHWSALSRFKFLFPLALPSAHQLIITSLPSAGDATSDKDASSDGAINYHQKPVVQFAESTTGGSTLRSRDKTRSRQSSGTGSVSGKSTQSYSVRSEINTLDRKPPILKKRPPPPPPRFDSIPKDMTDPELIPVPPSPPLPPPPHPNFQEHVSDASSEEGTFPPPPILTTSSNASTERITQNLHLWESPASTIDIPTYATPNRSLKVENDQPADPEENEESVFAEIVAQHKKNLETQNIRSLLSSFRRKSKRTLSNNLKAAFSGRKTPTDKHSDAWPYS